MQTKNILFPVTNRFLVVFPVGFESQYFTFSNQQKSPITAFYSFVVSLYVCLYMLKQDIICF